MLCPPPGRRWSLVTGRWFPHAPGPCGLVGSWPRGLQPPRCSPSSSSSSTSDGLSSSTHSHRLPDSRGDLSPTRSPREPGMTFRGLNSNRCPRPQSPSKRHARRARARRRHRAATRIDDLTPGAVFTPPSLFAGHSSLDPRPPEESKRNQQPATGYQRPATGGWVVERPEASDQRRQGRGVGGIVHASLYSL
jgi:hypothetical protein